MEPAGNRQETGKKPTSVDMLRARTYGPVMSLERGLGTRVSRGNVIALDEDMGACALYARVLDGLGWTLRRCEDEEAVFRHVEEDHEVGGSRAMAAIIAGSGGDRRRAVLANQLWQRGAVPTLFVADREAYRIAREMGLRRIVRRPLVVPDLRNAMCEIVEGCAASEEVASVEGIFDRFVGAILTRHVSHGQQETLVLELLGLSDAEICEAKQNSVSAQRNSHDALKALGLRSKRDFVRLWLDREGVDYNELLLPYLRPSVAAAATTILREQAGR